MNRQQMKDFIALNVEQQGDEEAINLSSLMYAIVDKLFSADDWADVKALLQTKPNITVKSVEA